MVKDIHDLENELAELKGFTGALACLVIVFLVVFLVVVGYILFQLSTLPNQVVSTLNEQLNFTPIK